MIDLYDPNQQKLAIVRELASLDGARLLDVGCGDGAVTTLMAQDAASVVGVDPDDSAIDRALATTPEPDRHRVSFRAGDVCATDFPPGAFDVVVFMRSL